MKKHQKLLSLLLSAVMAVSMLPGTGLEALAASRTYLKDGSYTKSAQVIPVEYEEDGETYTDFDQYYLDVTVTVSGEKITDITASGAKGKNKGYTSDALSGVKKKIIEKQSADGVDAVSEATCSSKAIIKAAKEAIADAKTTEEIVTVDKSSLQSAISAAQEKKEEDYTAASWTAFAKALADAKKAAGDDSAAQSTVDSAEEALKKAESGLVRKADKEALRSALDSAKSLKEEDYTEDSWKALQDAVKRGEEILAKEDAAQADADAAAEGIKNAKAALAAKSVTDYSALEKEVNDAQALKAEDYTEDSWKKMQEALSSAKALLAAAAASQEEVGAQTAALEDAVKALVPAGEEKEPVYVLMNIPYDKFYAAEGVSGVDAVTTATVKTYNQNMAAGSYHEGYTTSDASGARILGVTYPVLVEDPSALEGLTQVTDESSAAITVAAGKSSLTTKDVSGKDLLFASGSYAYYVLKDAPNRYKVMNGKGSGASFGPVTGGRSSGSAEYSLTYGGHYTEIDFQVSADGLSDAVVNAVVLTAGGEKYALTHVKNVWRKTDLGWNYDMMDLGGKTITNVTYYINRDGAYDVIDYPCDVTVKKQGNEIQAAFDTSFLMTVTGLPEDIKDPKATVKTVVGRGQTPVVIAEDVPVNQDGTLETGDFAVKDTNYRVTVVSGNYADMSAQAVYEGTYVLMNIPYDKFYAAELNNSVPVDAFTSATKNKPRTAGLAGGSYHVDATGSAITGVIYPVYFEADAFLKDQNRVKDDTTVDITVTNRGQTSTTTMTGADALFEAPSYSWYLLKEAPVVYKSAQAEGGTVSFGKTSAEASAAAGSASLTTKSGYGDYQIGVESDTVSGLDRVTAVVLKTKEGSSYGLRHMENIWRKTELAFCTGFTTNVHGCQTSSAHYEALMGQTITEIDYYTTDAVYAISTDLYVPIKLDTELTVEDAAAADGTTQMNLSKALPDDFDALYAAEGLDAEADGAAVTFNKDAKPGRYTLTLTDASGKYAPISADFTLTSAELPAEYNQGPEEHGLQAKEDADAKDFENYLKNITSVTVNGQTFNAAGRGALVLIDPVAGLIDLNAREGQIFTGDEEALTLTVQSTGYPDYEFTLAAPVIIQGMDGEWTKESGKDLSFTSNAGYAHLRSVLVDGEEIGEDAFTSEEGSTVIHLQSSFLETLAVGSHTIGVKSANGTAQTNFTVLEKKADDSSDSKDTKKDTDTKKNSSSKNSSKKSSEKKSTKTGDESSVGLWMVLLAAAAAGLVLYRRRRA